MRKVGGIFSLLLGLYGVYFIGYLVISFLGLTVFGGENEGTVKYDDCRQIINTSQGSWNTFFKKFTCDDLRSKNGRLISGTCAHVDISGGACIAAYVYTKKSDFNCGSNSTPNIDDSVYACTCNDGYQVNPKNHKQCIINSTSPTPTLTFQQSVLQRNL